MEIAMRSRAVLFACLCLAGTAPAAKPKAPGAEGGNMRVTSPAFSMNQPIPAQFSCDGQDVNPPLAFDGVPPEAKSLALIVDDPDAPGKVWVHWTVWKIDPKTREIRQDSVPPGAVQGVNDFGKTAWGGPCPPGGTHRYRFKAFALSFQPELAAGTSEPELVKAMQGKVIDKAELIGTYTRKR
jgi:Raf kinase inhibitor-like YbhB/YbcL family protein